MRLKQLLNEAMAYALRCGADQCEFFFTRSRGEGLSLRDGVLHDDNSAEKVGFSVRLMKGGVPCFSYGAIPNKESLRRAIDDALLTVSFLEQDPYYRFTEGGLEYPNVPVFSQESIVRSLKMDLLATMSEAATAQPHIARAERVSYRSNDYEVTIVNSLGLELYYHTAFCSASALVVAEDGNETETGSHYMLEHSFDALSPENIAVIAAKKAVRRLHAEVVDGGEFPVIFDPETVIDMISILLPSFLGDCLYKGKSRLQGKEGEIIASPALTLIDDPLLLRGIAVTPFDDEGMPSYRKALIREGKIESFLHNHVSAAHCHTESTGNGYCNSHKSLPSTSASNFYVLPGRCSPEDLCRGITHGLLVHDLMGLHMADSITGDFSLGISGEQIEHGEIGKSFRGVMMAGNIFDLLTDIEEIGSDFEFFGNHGAPSVKIKSMKISGK